MRDAAPQTIYLADYTPYGFIIDDVALHFDLDPRKGEEVLLRRLLVVVVRVPLLNAVALVQ